MMTTLNKDKDKLFVKANQDFTTQGQTFFGGQTYCWVKKTRQKICCGKYMELYYLTGPTDGCAFDNAIPVESSYVTLTITKTDPPITETYEDAIRGININKDLPQYLREDESSTWF